MKSLILLALLAACEVSAGQERIASFSPAATRILIDLGASENLAAATRWCELPAKHPARRNCDAFEPDIEALRASGATLAVLPRLANPMLAERVRSIGVQAIVLAPESPESPAKDIATLSKLLGRTAAGDKLLEARQQARRTPGTKRVLVIWDGVCAGPDSYLAWTIRAAGGEPALPSGSWPEWDIERVTRANPELVLVLSNNGPDQPSIDEASLQDWMRTAGLRTTVAAKNGQIYRLRAGTDWLPASGQPKAADVLASLLAK